jgi:hypothetical protein
MAGGPALAQNYRVEVVAPGELGRTLRQGLNLVRQQSDPGISPESFKRLLEEAER